MFRLCAKTRYGSPKDIEAEVYFFLPQEGGKSKRVSDGYRPQFVYDDQHWGCLCVFPDDSWGVSGEKLRTYIGFTKPQEYLDKLKVGMDFSVFEGTNKVASGVITELLELEFSAKRSSSKR